jgi:hypothetical protein
LQLGLKHANKTKCKSPNTFGTTLMTSSTLHAQHCLLPTQLAELFPDPEADALGMVDAAKAGMGRVMFTTNHNPILWCMPFPKEIQCLVVSFNNPHGTLTNSDLKQAGVLGKLAIMAQTFDVMQADPHHPVQQHPSHLLLPQGDPSPLQRLLPTSATWLPCTNATIATALSSPTSQGLQQNGQQLLPALAPL